MPWGRVDDTFHSHPKVLGIPVDIRMAAVGLHWMAISWCNSHMTDGKVPFAAIAALGGTDEQAAALVAARLWHRSGRSYRIHDFLDFNTSRASTEERHLQKAEAGRLGAAARWQKASSGMAPAMALSHGSDAPDPSHTRPIEKTPPPPTSGGRRKDATNPRARGASPRQEGTSPRDNGTSIRAEREAQKRGPTSLREIVARIQAEGESGGGGDLGMNREELHHQGPQPMPEPSSTAADAAENWFETPPEHMEPPAEPAGHGGAS